MLKYSNEEVSIYSYRELGKYFYQVSLRENITLLDDGRFSYNEYSLIRKSSENDIDEDIKTNFDMYLEVAKLNEEQSIKNSQIESLKMQLENSDYRIMKCVESYMLGSVLPYDFSQLITERDTLRNTINNLQDTVELDILEEAQNRKITEMCAICQTTITSGIDYNDEHYRLNTTDQINLTSLYALAQAGQSVPYHADGMVCRIYEPTEMIGLVQTSIQWIMYHTTYFNLLKHQILEMTEVDEVKSVYYGITLKDEYQQIINSIMGQ